MRHWVNERVSKWVNERVSKWVNERVSKWVNERVSKWVNERVSKWVADCCLMPSEHIFQLYQNKLSQKDDDKLDFYFACPLKQQYYSYIVAVSFIGEETRVPTEKHRPATSHWQIL